MKGHCKLIHNGFPYLKHLTRNQITFWRCSRYQSNLCKGKAKTKIIGNKQMVEIYAEHNHPPTSGYLQK